MNRYRFTPQAESDLFDIWSFIAEDSVESADRVESAIFDAYERIAESPLIGVTRDDLTPFQFDSGCCHRSATISSFTIPKPSLCR